MDKKINKQKTYQKMDKNMYETYQKMHRKITMQKTGQKMDKNKTY